MVSSTRRSANVPEARLWRAGVVLAGSVLLSGCLGATPDRARIVQTRLIQEAGGAELELTQDLRFSRSMRDALAHGIPLRLVYGIEGCGADVSYVLELRYEPLFRHYELRRGGEAQARRFARRSTLLAALDRIRLPLPTAPKPDCNGWVSMALDLTALPTPLRFPALLQREEWRLISPRTAWHSPPSRA
jgi:hypothetical protein